MIIVYLCRMSMLIVLEGLDGAGKSTQVRQLKKYLEEHNVQSIKIDDLQYDFLCDSICTLRKKWLKAHKGKSPERKEYMKPREDLAQLAQATIDKIKSSGKPN